MPTPVPNSRAVWGIALLVSVLGGTLAGWVSSLTIIAPGLKRLEQMIDQTAQLVPPVETTSTPVAVIPLESASAAALGLPPALRVGRASPTLPLFRIDARTPADRVFSSERNGVAIALTNDGWLVTTDAGFSTPPRLADLGIGWKGRVLTPTQGLRDRATGLLYLKLDVRDLPAAALVSRVDVELGQSAWGERLTGQYIPTTISGLGFATSSASSWSSDQWNRRFFLAQAVSPIAAPIWDARGQLLGLALPSAAGATMLPADAIRSGLASILADGQIRRPSLGVRYLELADTFSRQPVVTAQKGALLVGEKGLPAIVAQGPAATALREGDVIERIDQDILDGTWTLAERVQEYRPGTVVTIAGLRQGKPFEARVTFGTVMTSEILK